MKSKFQNIARDLTALIGPWEQKLRQLPLETVSMHRNNQNRTIKEILGHMVDSATNNTHRIVHLQYQQSPISYPDYANLGNNDRWIAIQKYQEEDWDLLVSVWAATHWHIAHVIVQVELTKLQQIWTSALDEEVTLEAMIIDFPRHFRLHLGEIETLIETTQVQS